MTGVLEPLKKKKRYGTPILFAEWTGWFFWACVLALLAVWVYVVATAPEPTALNDNSDAKPILPKIVEYSVTGSPVSVDVYRVPVSVLFPVSDLVRNARSCRQKRTAEQFQALLRIFGQAAGQVYSFRYLGKVSDNGILPVVAIPNAPHYADLAAFKKDFDSCLTGSRHPFSVSENWLLFVEDCPGYRPNSPAPPGCALIKKELTETLKLVR